MNLGAPLAADMVDIFDELVVPRYLAFFGPMAVEMLIPVPDARVANLGCRTGYPDAAIAERMGGGSLVGVDPSEPALAAARAKAAPMSGMKVQYELAPGWPTPLPDASFTHGVCIHPLCNRDDRSKLFAEMFRVLVPGGQAVVALPLRGSFPEINDMIREFALRADLAELGAAVDAAAQSRPTIETIAAELEGGGLCDVDVDVQLIAVSFTSGRDFLDDPIAKLMILPDTRAVLGVDEATREASIKYVHDAIAKYWSEGVFELTVNVGCASARRA